MKKIKALKNVVQITLSVAIAGIVFSLFALSGISIDGNALKASVLSAFSQNKNPYNIAPSKTIPGTFTFNYQYAKVKPKKGQANFDLPIVPFDDAVAQQALGEATNFGPYRDDWNYPVGENAYMRIAKGISPKKVGVLDTKIAYASDPGSVPGLVNCRANTSVTGFFEAYFEDVAADTNVGYDDPLKGAARRDTACQVLQDIATLIKLDQTNVTPDILFAVNPGNMPAGALAAATAYSGYYNFMTGPDNGSLHKHIISHIDPTPGLGNFDALVLTNFNGVSWDVDSSLSTATYSFRTVITHEVLHALGFRGLLPAVIPSTNIPYRHTTLDLNTYTNTSLTNRFFNGTNGLLQVPLGAPSSWFVNTTDVYQGIKNTVGATVDGIRPVYSPASWQQGSSLSHFDMSRAGGKTYIMNPSISTNTPRTIHDDEKEVLCHEGYQVFGMIGCEQPTPLAADDQAILSGTQMCLQPLSNDTIFTTGTLALDTVTQVLSQPGDTITYFTSGDCTAGSQTTPANARSIKIVFGSSTAQRMMQYTNKDASSGRISNPATITLDPVLSCDDTYNFLTQWGSYGSGNGQMSWSTTSLETDSLANVYIADNGNSRVQKFDQNGNYVAQLPGSGGVTIDADDAIFIPSPLSGYISKYAPTGTLIAQLGSGLLNGRGLGFDTLGNIYVNEYTRIQKLNSSWVPSIQFGQFTTGYDMAVNSAGDIYVPDTANRRVQKYNSSGNLVTQWGTYGSANGQFGAPYGIGLDSAGNVYVPDCVNNNIQKFDANGGFIVKFGMGHLSCPFDVAVDGYGNVYAANGYGYGANGRSISKFATNCPTSPIPHGTARVSGKVYSDQNSNGSEDSGEVGINGVVVGLYPTGVSTPLQTVTTENIPHLGEYLFTNIPVGNYRVALVNESIFPDVTEPILNTTTILPGYNHARPASTTSNQTTTGMNFGVLLGTDVCTNISGIQASPPLGFQQVGSSCDACVNMSGIQSSVPSGYTNTDGQCIKNAIDTTSTTDMCPNIDGVQTTVPAGYVVLRGQCVKLIKASTIPLTSTPIKSPAGPQ
jgi:hypothetical protein